MKEMKLKEALQGSQVKSVVKKEITFKNYKDCLFGGLRQTGNR